MFKQKQQQNKKYLFQSQYVGVGGSPNNMYSNNNNNMSTNYYPSNNNNNNNPNLNPNTINNNNNNNDYDNHHTNSYQSISTLKDAMISLQYRIKTLQSQVHTKMQRQECFSLLQRKANTNWVRKLVEEVNKRSECQKEREDKEMRRFQQQQRKLLQGMRKKLRENSSNGGGSSPVFMGNNANNSNSNNKLLSNNNNNNNNNSNNILLSPSSPTTHPHPNHLIKPQQLYLQSNQTMFSMLIDQINTMKHNQSLIQRLIQSKHKKTITLNNEVCRKLQSLQNQMQEIVKYVDCWYQKGLDMVGNNSDENGDDYYYQRGFNNNNNGNGNGNKKNSINKNPKQQQQSQQSQKNFLSYHSSNPKIRNKHKQSSSSYNNNNKKLISKSEKRQQQQFNQQQLNLSSQQQNHRNYYSKKAVNVHYQHGVGNNSNNGNNKNKINNNNQNNNNNNLTHQSIQSFQSIRLQLFSKSLQTIQKQLTQKLNIKDLLPFIKQNIPNLEQPIQEIKIYVEENFQSMKKILENQSQINQQLTKANKVAWFHCYDKYTVATSQTERNNDNNNNGQGILSQQAQSQTQRSSPRRDHINHRNNHQNQNQNSLTNQPPLGYILFSQQLLNLIPQNIEISKQQQQQYTLKIHTKGWYLIKLYIKQVNKDTWQSKDQIQQILAWIEVNGIARYPLMTGGYRMVNLAQDSFVRVITEQDDVFVEVRKL